MFYVIFIKKDAKQFISTSLAGIEKATGIKARDLSKVLDNKQMYGCNDYLLLVFTKSDIIKQPARNHKGNTEGLLKAAAKLVNKHGYNVEY